jgi:2-succinyl-5-enolpyruvyl-6-hydroxy-3-cyclohexene-1-carboxylate synthase
LTTDKKNIQALVEVCRIKGIRHIVFSPGSRSAPLVIGFSQVKEMQCTVIADERVAGFFALGIAQQSRIPVAVVCTSGTAVLNLAPAICEAYYQQVPLLILTADRPPEYIGIGENQAILQTNIYSNYIRASYTLSEDAKEAAKITAEAIDLSTLGYGSPVHINIPLSEPLYGTADIPLADFSIAKIATQTLPPAPVISLSAKTMLICGMQQPDAALQKIIQKLSLRDDIVIVAEPLSNITVANAVKNVDGTIILIKEEGYAAYAPDTIITIDGQIVSKRIRQFLRKVAPANHYHISTDRGEWNGLGAKEYHHIVAEPKSFLAALSDTKCPPADYNRLWQSTYKKAIALTNEFARQCQFSDWSVFDHLTKSFPDGANIHYGNSSPVRYGGFFEHKASLSINSNRGTSGIDGCVSTAAGAAFQSGKLTICIVGDISFLYDSNALWNNALSPHLRIIVINNGGGNIFRLIEGPGKVHDFEKYFEASHKLSAEYLAQMYQIPYYFCQSESDMVFVSGQFYKPQKGAKPAIMEIKTDGVISDEVYKQYFEFLKTGYVN